MASLHLYYNSDQWQTCMSSVDKRRRERIRAKQAAREGTASFDELAEPKAISRSVPDGHVSATPGRKARLLRRSQRPRRDSSLNAETIERSSIGTLMWRGAALASRPLTLRRRRTERRRERDRREGSDRPETRVRPRGVVWISWRWLSAAISVFLIVILYVMLSSPIFFVDTIAVGGERYLTPEQIFDAADIANKNLYWINARDIEQRLESNSSIADAQVFIGWPPNSVSIFITERDPALIWEEGDSRFWVDVNGIIMFQRQEREDLLRIVYQGNTPRPLAELVNSRIPQEIVAGALQLKAKLPTIKVMLYDPIKGLGIREEGNWRAWFGVGTDMERRLLVYQAIVRTYYPTIQFAEVDVSDADHPTYINRFPQQ